MRAPERRCDMTLQELIQRVRGELNAQIAEYNDQTRMINKVSEKHRLSEDDEQHLAELHKKRGVVEAKVEVLRERLADLEKEAVRDQAIVELMSGPPIPTAAGRALAGGSTTETTLAGVGQATGQPRTAPGGFVRLEDRQPAAVARGQRFADHPVVQRAAADSFGRDAAIIGQHGDLGTLVRSLSTTSGGSAIVPTEWLGTVLDRARNLSACLLAGAQLVPMGAKTVEIGRLLSDPSAAFRAEGSDIEPSDPVFDSVTLTSRTMSALVIGTNEWFQDAINAEDVVVGALAQAFANQLDLVCLYGSIETGAGDIDLASPPNPRGILGALNAVAPSSVLGTAAVNGTTPTAGHFWDEIVDAVWTPRDANETPNAMIWNSRLARTYAKATDTTGQPLQMPGDVTALQRFVSNQIPVYTKGETDTATDVFAGDFTNLLVGQRLEMTVQVLTERYADTGHVGLVASWRGDVALARPRAFSVYRALKAA